MRAYELAKELGVTSVQLVKGLADLGIEVKNSFGVLEPGWIDRVRALHSLGKFVADAKTGLAAPVQVDTHLPPPPPPEPEPAPKPAPKPARAAKRVAVPVPEPKPAEPPKAEEAPQAAEPPAPPAPKPEAKPEAPKPVRMVAPRVDTRIPASLLVKAEPKPAPAAKPAYKAAAKAAAPTVKADAEPVPSPAKTAEKAAASKVDAGVSIVCEGKVLRMRSQVVVKELAQSLGLRPNDVIAELMKLNVLASINQRVDAVVARKIAEKHGFTLEQEKRGADHPPLPSKRAETPAEQDKPEDLSPRPPVVTFLGHVDHGKTSLMDRIRKSQVAKGEHGGITQHIGAYTVDVSGRKITFLDTPGHAAFTAMRARGANLTDIAVIVVDSADGIMPQTEEAISHAKAAEVAIMVAMNKIDLPTSNPDKVRRQLQAIGLAPEEWGGTVICAPVSAMTGEGIDHFLEMILLQADMLELKANPHRRAEGFVIEAQLEAGMGPTATLLVTRGTLKIGDAVLCGPYAGSVRALINDHGVKVKTATPGLPVKCLGLPGVPEAGAEFKVLADERTARELAGQEAERQRQAQFVTPKKASLENLFEQMRDDKPLELRMILKTDTQGSLEAISHALQDIKSDKVHLDLLLTGAGNITVSDVMLASASNAVVMGFHVAREPGVDNAARHEGVEIYLHNIIYEMLDQVRDSMSGLLSPEIRETVRGHARVQQLFPIGKTSKIAGCLVTDGTITARLKVRVKRGTEVLYSGSITSLKRYHDTVKEVLETQECGIRLDKDLDYVEGDILEFYELQEVKQTL